MVSTACHSAIAASLAAEREQRDAEVDARRDVVGPDPLGVLELGDRGVVDAHVAVDVAEPDAQVGELGHRSSALAYSRTASSNIARPA